MMSMKKMISTHGTVEMGFQVHPLSEQAETKLLLKINHQFAYILSMIKKDHVSIIANLCGQASCHNNKHSVAFAHVQNEI